MWCQLGINFNKNFWWVLLPIPDFVSTCRTTRSSDSHLINNERKFYCPRNTWRLPISSSDSVLSWKSLTTKLSTLTAKFVILETRRIKIVSTSLVGTTEQCLIDFWLLKLPAKMRSSSFVCLSWDEKSQLRLLCVLDIMTLHFKSSWESLWVHFILLFASTENILSHRISDRRHTHRQPFLLIQTIHYTKPHHIQFTWSLSIAETMMTLKTWNCDSIYFRSRETSSSSSRVVFSSLDTIIDIYIFWLYPKKSLHFGHKKEWGLLVSLLKKCPVIHEWSHREK